MDKPCEIRKYGDSNYCIFKAMFKDYFLTDLKIKLTDAQFDEVCAEIVQSVEKQIGFLDLLFINSFARGFVNYQVDTPASNWCERENWGFIREIYIAADIRGQGYGKELAEYAENMLWKLKVPNIYLTTDDAKYFWFKMGYRDTGEICAKNDGFILIK